MTDFVCCDEFAMFCDEEDFTPKEISEEYNFSFCPFCGYKLTMLS